MLDRRGIQGKTYFSRHFDYQPNGTHIVVDRGSKRGLNPSIESKWNFMGMGI
jgi:hypothetical protein